MILYYVKSGGRYGIGHLKRAVRIAGMLAGKGFKPVLAVSTPEPPERLSPLLSGLDWRVLPEDALPALARLLAAYPFRAVFADAMNLTPEEAGTFRGLPVVSFDDYGEGQAVYEASVCALPYHSPKHANVSSPKYLPLDPSVETLRKRKPEKGTVLVSFGGSDPRGIARRVAEALDGLGLHVLLAEGPLCRYDWADGLPGVEVLHSPERLAPYIARAETVVTSIGMTLHESQALGRKVVVITPEKYHARIAAGIPGVIDLGLAERVTAKRIAEAVLAPAVTYEAEFLTGREYAEWIGGLTGCVVKQGAAVCPVCGSAERLAIRRGENATLFRCKACRSNYVYRLVPLPDVYREDYFEGRYEAAYGKTLEEDEANVRAAARRRLDTLSVLGAQGGILDAGAGTGVFLDEAKKYPALTGRPDGGSEILCTDEATGEEICLPVMKEALAGVEVSAHCRKTARAKFAIEMTERFGDVEERFGIVTMWFALEHVRDPREWIVQARRILPDGGILALGLPNGDGWFARRNPEGYFAKRPVEHEFEPSVQGICGLLAGEGFAVRKIEYFGLHPDRIGLPDSRLFRWIQKISRRGDTFEIYAEKLPETR